MHCHICDREDDTITRDPHERGGWSSCRTCQAETYDTIISYDLNDAEENELFPGGDDFHLDPKYVKGRIDGS